MGMYGNGAGTGMALIVPMHRQIQWAHPRGLTAFYVVAAGSTTGSSSVRRFGTTAARPTGSTATTVSVLFAGETTQPFYHGGLFVAVDIETINRIARDFAADVSRELPVDRVFLFG